MFEHSPDAVFLTRPDGAIEAANPAARAMLGMSEAEIRASGRDGILDSGAPELERMLAERERTGHTRGVLQIRRADGSAFPAEVTSARFQDAEGHPRSFVIARDISDRLRHEAELAASEQRYRSVFEHSMDGMLLLTSDGEVLAANPAALDLFGVDLDGLRARGRQGITDETDPEVRRMVEERRSEGRSHGLIRMIRAGGERFTAQVSAVQFRSAAGEDLVSVIIRDTTEQRERERRLAASEARYRELYQRHPDAVVEFDREGRFLQVNDATTALIEFHPSELIGWGFEPLVHADDLAAAWEHFQAVLGGETRSFRIRCVRKGGESFWAQVIGTPRTEAGRIVGVAGILRDVDAEHRAQRELAANEARLRAVFEHSMDAILLSAPDEGRLLECNAAAERLFGFSEAELKRRHRDQVFDTDNPESAEFLRRRDATGHARGVLTIIRADGTRMPVEATTSVFEDENGNRRSSVILRDISEALRRERELRESEDRYRALFQSSTDAIFISNPEGEIFEANPAAERLFGMSEEELRQIGRKGVVDLDQPEFRKLLKDRMEHGWARAELRLRRADGTRFLAEVSTVGFRDLEGNDRTSVVIRDVTELKRHQRALEQSEDRLRATVEAALDPIVGMDAEGRIVQFNRAAEACFGYGREQVLGEPLADRLIPERFRERHRRGLERYFETGESPVIGKRIEVTGLRSDGSEFPAELAINVTSNAKGTLFVGYVRDLTAQREQETRLKASEQRFRIVADNTGQAIYEIDLDSGAMTWAGACEHMFGVAADRLARLPAAERLAHIPGPDRDRVADRYREAAEAGGNYHFEYRLDTVDGRHIEVEDRGVVIADTHRMYGVIRDVTERNRLVRRLEEQKRTLSRLSETQQAILDALPAHVALLDAEGRIRFVNASWRRFAGSNDFRGFQAGQDSNYLAECERAAEHGSSFAVAVAAAIRRIIAGEQALFDGEYDCHSPSVERWFRQVITPYRSGGERGAVVAHLDVTDRVQAERQLELVAAAFRSADEALVICDQRFFIRDVNRAYELLIGQQREDAIGSRPAFLDIGRQGRMVMQGLERDGHWRGELLQRSLDGRVFTSRTSITEMQGSEPGSRFLVINFQDISAQREIERRVDYLSYHDALTGLPNRRALEQWFEQFVADAPDEGLAVAYMDLDRFKAVNEAFGHSIGDEVLVEMAQRLRRATGPRDYVARLGGDDFVVVLTGMKRRGQAVSRVRALSAMIAEQFKHEGHNFFASATAGISLYPEDGRGFEDLLRRADAAHSAAKALGRGQLQFFSSNMHEQVAQQALIESHLRDAIRNGELALNYQPSVQLPGGRIVGLEALARWESPELGMVSPTNFVAVAESTGLIIELGQWVLEAACAQVRQWRDRGLEFGRLAINLSPMQFQHADMLEQIRTALARHDLAGDALRVEITENVLVMDPGHTIRVLKALRDMGIEIAVDDFGTGYSSMAYLRSFPIQHIKLDRTFIKELPSSQTDVSIVSSVINLAHDLGMNVIAEGIETPAQREFLSEAGCDQAQGYLFSLPLRADDVPWLLECQSTLPVARAEREAGATDEDRGGK